MTKIKSITVLNGFDLGKQVNKAPDNLGVGSMLNRLSGWTRYDGYAVTLSDDTVFYLLVDDGQSCCEHYGYLSTNDEPQEFVGAELLGFKLTDTALSTKVLDAEGLCYGGELSLDAGGIQFVDFETDKGVLQIAVFNSHNGYYGHSILFLKNNEVLLSDSL